MSSTEKFKIILPPPEITIHPFFFDGLSSGSAKSFSLLYNKYSRKVYEYAVVLTGNPETSEDIVQDVFTKIWENRKMLNGVRNFTSYLHAMTRNRVNDYWRRIQTEKKYLSQQQYLFKTATDMNNTATECAIIINGAIEQLPRQQKIVYILKREEKWKRHHIAKALSLSPETVKAHLQKALRSIKKTVSRELD